MSAADADAARLELAKRAFQASQPSSAEVQTGVRRARLALDRAKPRRRWFSKGLVFVVLAVGSLAYAKPQALGELVEKVRPHEAAGAGKRLRLVRGPTFEPVETALRVGKVEPGPRHALDPSAMALDPSAIAVAPSPTESSTEASRGIEAVAASQEKSESLATKPSPPKKTPSAVLPATAGPWNASRSQGRAASATGVTEAMASTPTTVVSDWGRVGQALARGDDSGALAALNGLAESDDSRTRDNADLGRAQLLMAHGNPEKACALARSLTHRRAGGRIERQAQLILKSCGRP